jgi:vancomycin permeability regulator SanA
MSFSFMKHPYRWLGIAVLLPCLMIGGMVLDVQTRYWDHINPDVATQGSYEAIVILGASVTSDGFPSDALRDRLDEGLELYAAGRAPLLILTGDDGVFRSNEIAAMRAYVLAHGLPLEALRTDGKGYRTYESCRNAKAAGLQRIVLVTQRFHAARAVYLCNMLGIDTDFQTADRQMYRRIVYFWIRDLASSVKAWWDIQIKTPESPIKMAHD